MLIVIDQAVKLFILNFYMGKDITLLPNILHLSPFQNTNLSWIANIFNYKPSVILMVSLDVFFMIFIFIAYRYLLYLSERGKIYTKGLFFFMFAGICCSFIDDALWGGSLDFIRLFNWFTFDFKDVYLTIGEVFLFLWAVFYYKMYFKLSREERRHERKQKSFLLWIKSRYIIFTQR